MLRSRVVAVTRSLEGYTVSLSATTLVSPGEWVVTRLARAVRGYDQDTIQLR